VLWLPTASGATVQWQNLLREGETAVVIPGRAAVESTGKAQENAPPTAWLSWLALGVEHILFGLDHLLFVLGLALVAGWNRRLVWAITAFTLAHSVTLAGAALGWVVAPGAAVELLIAASVLLLAAEATRGVQRVGPATATQRWPALVALLFGLVHGFGFAGAIASLGLPREGTLAALLAFNGGIELGQLSVLALAGGLVGLVRRTVGHVRAEAWAPRMHKSLAYAMGCVAGVWTIGRALTWWAQLAG
jgi:hydrogenase/urease accessory protein HupE